MNIITQTLVARAADMLDFAQSVDNTINVLTERQRKMIADQMSKLASRYYRALPHDVDKFELSKRVSRELARRKIAAQQSMVRKQARIDKHREQQQLDARMGRYKDFNAHLTF